MKWRSVKKQQKHNKTTAIEEGKFQGDTYSIDDKLGGGKEDA